MIETVKDYIEFSKSCGYDVALVSINPYGRNGKQCINPSLNNPQDARISPQTQIKVGSGSAEILDGEFTGYKLLLHTTGLEGLRMAGFTFNNIAA